jgi:ATP-dependent DNA helicase RecG
MDLEDIKGIGKAKKKLLQNLNIYSIKDLLYHQPRTYEDRRKFHSLQEALNMDNKATLVKVKVIDHQYIYGRKKKILKMIISDGSLNASLVCFNQDFLKKTVNIGDDIIVYGKFQFRFDEAQSTSFDIIKDIDLNTSYEFGRIIPIYNLTEGLHQKFMRKSIHYALSIVSKDISSIIPDYIQNKRNMLKLHEALWEMHFPSEYENIIRALNRLKYEEMFKLEFNIQLKKLYNNMKKGISYTKIDYARNLIKKLPYKLTTGQKNALKDIKKDLFSNKLMNRLIQGDVGSGKTVIAIIAMIMTYENGYQSAIMAPTEVLAIQHYLVIKKLLKDYNIKVDVLYSSMTESAKKMTLHNLKEGKTDIIIGTHSLFSENVVYKNLNLVVVDEQHKFGVRQRISLIQKGVDVNVMVMTATPIPRTISLTYYGDMDISLIKDKPKDRKEIKTKVLYQDERIKALSFVKSQIEQGKQAYIIYPIIEESEKLNIPSANYMYEELSKNEFMNINLGLLHGKMDTEKKQKVMNDFTQGKIQVLISTTVIEVGIDNPNATVMVIENAERFGLSQLHQLRGRIGRGTDKSYCYLMVNRNISEEGKERMRAMVKYNDGFRIAEKDLEIRGGGEFFGVKQSGISDLKFIDLVKDYDFIKVCIEDIKEIINDDPYFIKEENQILNKTLYKEFINENQYYLKS